MKNLGKQGKDKITGFEGIIVGKADYLFGCSQYAIAPQNFNKETNNRPGTEWFDVGRIDIIGEGIAPAAVTADKPGAEFNFDAPKNI